MKNRPILISIIAITQAVIASVFILYNQFVWTFHLTAFLMNISLLTLILLASFGLWKAKQWGWWLTNIYYIQVLFNTVISTINYLYIVPRQFEGIEVDISNMLSPVMILTIIIGLFIPFYLFRKTTLHYFNINNDKTKLILITIIAFIWSFSTSFLLFN
ncbi:hypothetical protein [Evansella cellulosilytica]|uniref:Uncharacterized protein n=1 Tax=Evansella cellulosilytica (strain ATCC 21833 / DSM 2522 / FERM P-1141 / JCM 9156 / N-4) TaxID=649639 RepID=E6TWE2_EVAC2|nr:hypothetical protein [Evansella cellulosilytica]ADU32205.1 hypothetical protein Bcell_3972 [Evansella cellulosilytica DSM 2522]